MKAIVLYTSRTGFTERYAEWIARALGCEAVPYDGGIRLEAYDTVVYGGGFHAGMIGGLKAFLGKLPRLEGKRVAVFATGATPADAPDVEKAMRQNFTDAQWHAVRAFYLQSGLCYEKMSRGDRAMMAVFRAMLRLTHAQEDMQRMVARSFDCCDIAEIEPIVRFCREG